MKKLFNRRSLPVIMVIVIMGLCFAYAHCNSQLWGACSQREAAAAVHEPQVKMAEAAAENSKITKNETVYVKLTPAGQVKDTTVVSWLHFSGDVPGEVLDPVRLEQIKALNGAFKVEKAAGGIRISDLEAGQYNVYYSGSSDQSLPVRITVEYYLDGKKISPQELAGNSGQVKMVFKLNNQLLKHASIPYTDADGAWTSEARDIYTPLAAMISLELPADRFSEVQTEEGMITAVGETMKVNYIVFPYPSTTVTLSMQAEDFRLEGINVVVQPHMPPLPDLSSAKKLNELYAGLGKVNGAMSQLESGSDELAGGQDQLIAGLKLLQAGTDQLILLNQAEEKIAQGVLVINGLLVDGVKPLAEAPGAAEPVKSLYAGLQKQNELLTTMVKGGKIEEQELPPMSTTSSGLGQARDGLEQLIAGGEKSRAGLQQLHQGVAGIRGQGMVSLQQGVADSLNEVRIGQGQIAQMEKAVNDYDSFLGKPAGSQGKVQFIYQSEPIK